MPDRPRWPALLPAAIFVVAVFSFMPGPLLGQSTYGAVDMIELGSPYRDAIGRPPDVESPVQLDQLEEFPWAQAFFNNLRRGEWPNWDPNAGAGVPSGTLPLKGTLSPFSVGFLFLPGWYALSLKIALTLGFCMAFTYLLLRRLGAGRAAATLAGLAYTFSGVNIVFLHRVSAQMVLPAMLWAAHRLVEQPGVRRAASLALFVAWAWFEGFPSGFVYCVYVTAAWCAWLMLRRGRPEPRRVLTTGASVAGGFLLGIALAAVNLVPFLSEVTSRGILERRDYGARSHLPSIQYFGLFELDALGRYPEGPWWSGMNPVESISHFGMIAGLGMGLGLAFAIAGRVRLTPEGRVAWSFFAGLAALGLVLNFAGGPLLDAAYEIPGIANNLITRSRFLLALSAAVLGSLALDSLWSRDPDRERAPRVVSAVALAGFAAGAVMWFPEFQRQAAANRQGDLIVAGAGRNAALALVALALALAARRRPRWSAAAASAIAILLFFQLAFPLRNFTPASPVSDYYSVQAGHRVLDRLVGDDYRFAAAGRFTFSLNSGQILGIPDLRGMALPSRQFRALGRAISEDAFAEESLGIVVPRDSWDLSSPLLDDLAIGYFVLGTEERPYGVTVYEDLRFDEWRAIDDGFVETATFSAPGPINGMAVPIQGSEGCTRGRMTLTLESGDREPASSSRPAFDVLSSWLHFGIDGERRRLADWYWFAVDGQGMKAGDPYSIALAASAPGCRLKVGAIAAGAGWRPAVQLSGPDPAYPLKLVSTTQGWMYERPTAWKLVSAHSRWRAFPDQKQALDYSAGRPDTERDVVSYVGEEVSEQEGAEPARLSRVRIGADTVDFATDGRWRSLVVVSQNADNGWQARIDGRPAPIVKVDGALAGVFVPAGNHRVSLRYRPPVFVASAWVSALAALALAAAYLPWRRRGRPAEK